MAIGPSTTQTPYIVSTNPDVTFTSILSAGDVTSGYTFDGTPDGIGAFDNGDGTFTLLVNHEFVATDGIVRAHGAAGSFVSEYVINKSDLSVVSGQDLDQHINIWNTSTQDYQAASTTSDLTMVRLCSADLPQVSAFYDASTGLGTEDRIFLNGEESVALTGTPPAYGRIFAHVATGAEAHNAYELASLGNYAVENELANWGTGDLTLVAGNEDTGGGQVYFYAGHKQATGNAVEKAGLVGGDLNVVQVVGGFGGQANEDATHDLSGSSYQGQFKLLNLGDVSAMNATDLQNAGVAAGQSGFNRPEDGAWDANDPSKYYFVTTASYPGTASRLWELDFTDIKHPELGGTIKELLDGTEGQAMFDNISVSANGHIVLLEDVGNSPRAGRVWDYDTATDTLTQLAQHDVARFGQELTPGSNTPDPAHTPTAPFTQDEEASGVVDVTSILGSSGERAYLLDTQSHYLISGEVVEGGQLQAMHVASDDDASKGQVLNGQVGEHNEDLTGGVYGDVIHGYQGADILNGRGGNDQVYGDAGDDFLTLGLGDDTGTGGAGDDVVRGKEGADLLFGGDGADTLQGGAGADVMHGDASDDQLSGGLGADILFGDDGRDNLLGGEGDDTLYGGLGADTMNGSAGADSFVFTSIHDSDAAAPDLIKAFSRGVDLIDLSKIDADLSTTTDDAFQFVSAFTSHAGEAVLSQAGGQSLLELDQDGDGAADFVLAFSGHLSAADTSNWIM
jgi:Ca2+-binding RTX toxin-like protein